MRAHGFLAKPKARNVLHNSDYCPHCLNAGGAAETALYGWGACGDPQHGPRHHEAFGKYGPDGSVQATWRAGETVTLEVKLYTNHLGRFHFRLCPLPGDGSLSAERRALDTACLQSHVLQRADGAGRFTYVPDGREDFAMRYVLPADVECERCVLQWFYHTGHSCTLPGTPREYANPQLRACGTHDAPPAEVFINCADVRVTADRRRLRLRRGA